MDYSTFFNNFWKAGIAEQLSGNEVKLYFFLVHGAFQKGSFQIMHADRNLSKELGMANNTARLAVDGLLEHGLLLSKETTNQGTIYHLAPVGMPVIKKLPSRFNEEDDFSAQTTPPNCYYSTTTGI